MLAVLQVLFFLKCAHKRIAPLLRFSEKRCKSSSNNCNRQIIACRNFFTLNLRQIFTAEAKLIYNWTIYNLFTIWLFDHLPCR